MQVSLRWRNYQQRKKESMEGKKCIKEDCDGDPVFKCPKCGIHVCGKHRSVHWVTHQKES